jgi:hypothetical protein
MIGSYCSLENVVAAQVSGKVRIVAGLYDSDPKVWDAVSGALLFTLTTGGPADQDDYTSKGTGVTASYSVEVSYESRAKVRMAAAIRLEHFERTRELLLRG